MGRIEKKPDMNHAQLKAFHAVAKAGGFTSAARSLGLTQPAITLQVQALERKYNTSLFERRGRQIDLTASGLLLLNLSTRYFSIEEEAHLLLSSIMQVKTGRLRIACDIAPRAFPITAKFRELYPNIELSISICSQRQLQEDLTDHLVDIAIAGTAPDGTDLRYQVISEEEATVTLPVNHRLATASQILLAELDSLKILIFKGEDGIGKFEQELLACANFSPKSIIFFNNREMLQEAIAHGEGISFLSQKEVDRDRRLVSIPISGCHVGRAEYLAYHKDKQDTPLISTFRKTWQA